MRNRCSFCIIPSVRGQSRSMKLDRVIEEANALVAAGYREIVLSGINLGRWGRDFQPQQKFEQLVRALLEYTSIEKIRISSVEPMDWNDDLIALVAGSPRIAKHAHVPLQSGSDPVFCAGCIASTAPGTSATKQERFVRPCRKPLSAPM